MIFKLEAPIPVSVLINKQMCSCLASSAFTHTPTKGHATNPGPTKPQRKESHSALAASPSPSPPLKKTGRWLGNKYKIYQWQHAAKRPTPPQFYIHPVCAFLNTTMHSELKIEVNEVMNFEFQGHNHDLLHGPLDKLFVDPA